MMRFSLFVLFIISTTTQALAQDWKRTQNWYFGDKAGLSFATNPPTALTDGAMGTIEGCATISDTAGNLLFYTNGLTVWNKNHQIMDNGTGLLGGESSTQSSLIVPQPDNDSLYYIFTTHGAGLIQEGFRYNIVNLKDNSGLGKIISKNNLLVDVVCEKLTATHHANGKDIWVMVHGFPNDSFYAYLVTEKGLIVCPVITEIGSVHGIPNQFGKIPPTSAQGGMKFSSSGRLLSVSVFGTLFKTELFHFDVTTGRISEQINIPNTFLSYCSEFSQNDSFLYIVDRQNNVYQYAVHDYSETAINNSRKILNNYSDDIAKGIQLAPNGSIYVSVQDSIALDIIKYPNKDSSQTNYTRLGQQIANRAALGLPNFITSYLKEETLQINYSLGCTDFSGQFFGESPSQVNYWNWKLINSDLNTIDSSNGQSYTFTFPDTGVYTVQLIADSDTLFKQIHIEPKLDLGKDTILCNLTEFTLTVPDNFRCIQWQDGSDTALYKVTQSGTYHVRAYDTKGCLLSDTVNIKMGNIGKPVISRSGDSLYTDKGAYTYQWYLNNNAIGASTPFHRAKQKGNYQVEVTDTIGCTSLSQEFTVAVLSVKEAAKLGILVYPNPLTKGQELNIESEKPINSIQVFNSLAQQVHSESELETNTYKLKNLNRGIYTLVINQELYFKIIIQ